MRLVPPSEADAPYTVSGLNRTIAEIIAGENAIVWVEAEISGLKRHSSGHVYLTLIDSSSQIPAVLWKSYATELPRDIREGDRVQVIATVKVYERGGYYQLDIRKIMRSGDGDRLLKLEQLKQKLFDEGLFDESRKRPIPQRVNRVAVITAETGAAFYDICNVVSRNAPQIDLVLVQAKVQGDDAVPTLVKALDQVNRYGNVDLIIFGRGGGSAEDLYCFNDESVVRAVAGSKIPVISAVGHEIDVSLCDFAADLRAATPSAAAEIVVSTHIGDKSRIEELERRFKILAMGRIAEPFRRYRRAKRSYLFQQVINRVVDSRIAVDSAESLTFKNISNTLSTARQQVANSCAQLNNLSPLTLLARGYGVVSNAKGKQVSSVDQIDLFDNISVRLKDGIVKANVVGKESVTDQEKTWATKV